jgi:hypothetical protein
MSAAIRHDQLPSHVRQGEEGAVHRHGRSRVGIGVVFLMLRGARRSDSLAVCAVLVSVVLWPCDPHMSGGTT